MVKRPCILWIVTTQWRAAATGYAGDPQAHTPTLDRLASSGVNYAQAVTPHPFGPFARAALLTGVPSPQNGVRDYFDALPEESRTVAHTLADMGYETAFFGKWHLGKRDPEAPLVGEAHARQCVPESARGGFDFWEGFESGFLLNDPWLHGTRLPAPQRFPGYQSAVVAERAAAWLASRREERTEAPWFACVSLEAPQPPYAAPADGVVPRDPAGLQLPGNVPRGGAAEAQARRELAGYYAHIEATDRAIGRLVDSVADDDPIVVVTSVHGDMHGAHGLFRKGWPHEESVRVPLLVWRRSGSPSGNAGRRSDEAVSLLELPAWSAAWAEGGPTPSGGLYASISMPSVVRLPHQCDRGWRGVRTPTRKLVLDAGGQPWLFFDLTADPGEQCNLVDAPERAAERAALLAHL